MWMVRLLSWRFDRQVPFINLDAPLLFLGLSQLCAAPYSSGRRFARFSL